MVPAEICRRSALVMTGGTSSPPSPAFLPQQTGIPSVDTAQLLLPLEATCTYLPPGAVAWPKLLLPQHTMARLCSSPHSCVPPPATCWKLPVGGLASRLALLPQHRSVRPLEFTPHMWKSPAPIAENVTFVGIEL